jgi:hypothetical protein
MKKTPVAAKSFGAFRCAFNHAVLEKIMNMNQKWMRRLLCGLAVLILCAGAVMAQDAPGPRPPGAGDPPPGCDCGRGHWWDVNRKSCVTGACDVPKMPDGDKGGGYFAWHGTLFVNTPCLPPVCGGNLNLTLPTGQPGWKLVSGPGTGYPITPVPVLPFPGWSTVPGATWISVDTNRGNLLGPGDYVYEYSFCLCAAAKGMNLSLSFLADNGAIVKLNGHQIFATVGNSNFAGAPRSVAYSAAPFWIIPGTNTIQIVVHNESSVTGLAALLTVRADNGACPK